MKNTRKIYKYEIQVTNSSTLKMPAGARILSVMEQYDGIVLYALVPFPNDFPEIFKEVSIQVVGTGHEINFPIGDSDFKFIGTVSLASGSLMFHVFYKDHGYWG